MIDYSGIHHQDFSYLSKGSKISGKLVFSGLTRISSQVEGEIQTLDDASLIIELDGKIKGDITCQNLEVYGQVDGTILSSGKVILYPSAFVKGQITTQSLVIHPGAQVEIRGHTKEA